MCVCVCVCVQVRDVINEEEKQFLKTLSRGKRLFERTAARLESNIVPGQWMCVSVFVCREREGN